MRPDMGRDIGSVRLQSDHANGPAKAGHYKRLGEGPAKAGHYRYLAVLAAFAVVAGAGALVAQQAAQAPPAPPQRPVFRASRNLILANVVVRDRDGNIVKGLTIDDFELFEDGQPQVIQTFAFEEISKDAPVLNAPVLAAAAAGTAPTASTGAPSPTADADAEPKPLTSDDTAGRRIMVLLFDTSSMQPEDVQKAADSAIKWVDEDMSTADLVAVASIGSSLQILKDFTSDKETVRAALTAFSATDGTATAAIDSSTATTDADANDPNAAADATDSTAVDVTAQELDTFNNDVRLRALTALSESLTTIQQKKAILYFSSGMQRNGSDNQIELRKTINAAVRANVAIYPVDSRGLQAVVPGGGASQASRGGVGAFSGRGVADQFSRLGAQQETLVSLAQDTGGTAFTDSNDFGEAFDKIAKDISSYYILGFSSSNPAKDGRFRRLRVRVKNKPNVRLEARNGYYADRDFTHTARTDRESLLQEQLQAPLPVTDVPVFVSSGFFRLAGDKYYVPVAMAVPGNALPASKEKMTLDVAGFIRDERGAPVGRIRDTLTVPPTPEGVAAKQVQYQMGMTLPPGLFSVKVVVRENVDGKMGSFETSIFVPELKKAPVKVSSIILSTQLKTQTGKSQNPLVRDGVELVPNLTHIVGHDQKMYLYYEVYDPTLDSGAPQLRTSLVFYRGKVKVFETPVVERVQIDAADRKAAVFQFEVPPSSLKPGLYTCQINIVDAVAGKFVFPRVELYVR
jgi:VWFA-related protein